MDLNSLKSRLSLALVMPRYDMAPDRNGMLSCPFHEDRTPNMQVSGESLYSHSTNCAHHGRHIDVIDLVMLTEGVTKHEAILRCKALAGELATALKVVRVRRTSELTGSDRADVYACGVPVLGHSAMA